MGVDLGLFDWTVNSVGGGVWLCACVVQGSTPRRLCPSFTPTYLLIHLQLSPGGCVPHVDGLAAGGPGQPSIKWVGRGELGKRYALLNSKPQAFKPLKPTTTN